jgi:uncharacterized membrane protein
MDNNVKMKLAGILNGRLYDVKFYFTISGVLFCFLPLFLVLGGFMNIELANGHYLSGLKAHDLESNVVRDLAILSFAITLPPMIDGIYDTLHGILLRLKVLSSSSHQVPIVGFSPPEKVLFLLGIEIGSLFVCVQSPSSKASSTSHDSYYQSLVLSSSLKCSLMLCSCSVILCLHRILPHEGRLAWTSNVKAVFMIFSMVIGCIILSTAETDSNTVGSMGRLMIAGFVLVLLSVCVFLSSVANWLVAKFQTRTSARKKEGDVPLFDIQNLVPALLMLTFLIAVAVDIPIIAFLGSRDPDASADVNVVTQDYDDVAKLVVFFIANIIVGLLVIILETRMKNMEIAKGLVRKFFF